VHPSIEPLQQSTTGCCDGQEIFLRDPDMQLRIASILEWGVHQSDCWPVAFHHLHDRSDPPGICSLVFHGSIIYHITLGTMSIKPRTSENDVNFIYRLRLSDRIPIRCQTCLTHIFSEPFFSMKRNMKPRRKLKVTDSENAEETRKPQKPR
jgi:hypothetical protein